MKVAVVGHVEWCRFIKVDRLPKSGEIVRAIESWEEAAGGGGVAASVLAKLADECHFFTSVGADEIGSEAIKQLEDLGVIVHAAIVEGAATKQAIVYIDQQKERTITVIGNLKPEGSDDSLPWDKLADMDAVYFVSGDRLALEAARKAKRLVATARVLPTLRQTSVELDALVMSAKDKDETYTSGDLPVEPKLVVRTEGSAGGVMSTGERYQAIKFEEEEIKDTYGCGDLFAAGLAYGLASEMALADTLAQAARSGAEAAQRAGAHGYRQ